MQPNLDLFYLDLKPARLNLQMVDLSGPHFSWLSWPCYTFAKFWHLIVPGGFLFCNLLAAPLALLWKGDLVRAMQLGYLDYILWRSNPCTLSSLAPRCAPGSFGPHGIRGRMCIWVTPFKRHRARYASSGGGESLLSMPSCGQPGSSD